MKKKIPQAVSPLKSNHPAIGSKMAWIRPMGTRAKSPAAVARNKGLGTPAIHRPRNDSTPCTKAVTRMPTTTARMVAPATRSS